MSLAAQVHWWYYPDSFHEWTSASKIQGLSESPMPTPDLWRVYARYVRDLDKFNEWMNEEDYMPDEEGGDADNGNTQMAEAGEGGEEACAGGKRKREEGDTRGAWKKINVGRPKVVGVYKALPAVSWHDLLPHQLAASIHPLVWC